MRGLFITLEGIEGGGKSTLLESFKTYFEENDIPALITHAPGATPFGGELRKLLLDTKFSIDPLTELFLFFADRQDQLVKEIEPALHQGKVVVCDRFHDSTVAYQGIGRGLGKEFVQDLIGKSFPKLQPDLTLILDLSVQEGLQRKKHQQALDRMEQEALPDRKSVV